MVTEQLLCQAQGLPGFKANKRINTGWHNRSPLLLSSTTAYGHGRNALSDLSSGLLFFFPRMATAKLRKKRTENCLPEVQHQGSQKNNPPKTCT